MGIEPKGHKVSPFLRLVLGLVMVEGGPGCFMLGYTVNQKADFSNQGPGLLIMLAGLVVAIIGLIVTVMCFVRAIRKWRTDEAPKGRFRTRIPALVLLLSAAAIGAFLLSRVLYRPLIPLPMSLEPVMNYGKLPVFRIENL